MKPSLLLKQGSRSSAAFTLLEVLAATVILAAMITLIAQLFNSTTKITTLESKRMDADAHARALFDRMSVDLGRIVKRSDVSYYLKSPSNTQAGNDQMAFYSEVPGYYPSTGSQSPVSLVGYRSNSTTGQTERLGKGLLWNGVSTTETPVVFLPSTIAATWLAATNASADIDYEPLAPQVFRLEYFYLLKGRTLPDGTVYAATLSATPWDTRVSGHTTESGLQDVAAVGVAIAVADSKTRALITDTQLSNLGGDMVDFAAGMKSGDLEAFWNKTIIANTTLPRAGLSSLRVYSRYFYLAPQDQ